MNWKKILGILVGLAAIGYIGYAIFFSGKEEKEITVRVTEAKEDTITETVSLSGLVEPSDTQNVFGQGVVTDLPVKVGDKIEKGDKLVSFTDFSIPAKFDGTVTAINVKENEPDTSAQTGTPAVVLADLDQLQVGVDLTKTDAPLIKKDQKATLTSGKDIYKGRVSEVDPMATAQTGATGETRALHAVLTFDKEPEDLIAGFDIDVEIATASAENALTIPVEALVYNSDNKPFVYTVKDNVVHVTPIEIGLQSANKIEVKDGLSKGETVVLSPEDTLKEDVTVKTEKAE